MARRGFTHSGNMPRIKPSQAMKFAVTPDYSSSSICSDPHSNTNVRMQSDQPFVEADKLAAMVPGQAGEIGVGHLPMTHHAYFSSSWTPFQADRGRDFSVIVDGVSV